MSVFSKTYGDRISEIRSDVVISSSFAETDKGGASCCALWDTGANASAISNKVAEKLGLVAIDHSSAKPYSAALSRSECEKNERADLLHRIYEGNMSSLITAFIKDSKMKPEEVERLKKLLDEMEE